MERREVQRRRILGLPPPSSPGPDSGPDSSPDSGPDSGPSPGPSLGPSAVVDQWLVSRLEQGLALDPNDLHDDKNDDKHDDDNDEDDDGRLGTLSYHEDDDEDEDDEDREDGLSYRDVYGEQVEVFTMDIPGRPSRHRHHRRMGNGEGKDKGLNSDEGLVKGSGKEDEESINPFIKPSIKLSINLPSPTHPPNKSSTISPNNYSINSPISTTSGLLTSPYDDEENDLRFTDISDPSRGGLDEVGVVKVSVNDEYIRLMNLVNAAARDRDKVREEGGMVGEEIGGRREEERDVPLLSQPTRQTLSLSTHEVSPSLLPPPPHNKNKNHQQPLPSPSLYSQDHQQLPPLSPSSVVLSLADVYRQSGTGGGNGNDEYGIYEENEVYRR